MDKPKLSLRLTEAASLALDCPRRGSVADIGTDHALLPIFLAMSGYEFALASDIREGPAARARENVEKYQLSDRISVACRPGLDGITDFAPDCICICGMGGEMIASILEASEYPKSSRCRLVLQPQSMQEVLRGYLCREGFRILDERVVLDEGKYYQLIAAEFTDERFVLDPVEAKLGAMNLARAAANPSDSDHGWLEFVRRSASARLAGRKNAQIELDLSGDEALVSKIDQILNGGHHADCK